jgi:hypothetical protein
MKRSEAIKLIKLHYDCFTSGCSSNEESENHARQLLTKLEKAGMLPPLFNGGNWADTRDYLWEPENET